MQSRQTVAVVRHSLAVAALGRRIAKNLNKSGLQLDIALITNGCLLHDIAKGQRQHALEGSKVVRSFGNPLLAEVIAFHMDLVFDERNSLDETAIVFFADKLIQERKISSLEVRFAELMRIYAERADILVAIKKRFSSLQCIRKKIIEVLTKANCNTPLPAYLREAD